jgi:S1-C subfamily serine protease
MSADLSQILPCIVKLEVVHTTPSYVLPWQSGRSLRSTSSGFIISNQRIVTNAHCVAGAAQVRIRRPNSARKFEAKVVSVGRDCDLAILSVADDAFWTGRAGGLSIDIEQRRNVLPDLEERVSVVGFPTGGDSVSVTSGVVSRIEVSRLGRLANLSTIGA